MNEHARILGRRGKGKKKTMSPASFEQRKFAGLSSASKRAKRQPFDIGQRFRAYKRFLEALQSGEIERGRCQICGEVAQGHHEDYSKPLTVTWLCRKHHA